MYRNLTVTPTQFQADAPLVMKPMNDAITEIGVSIGFLHFNSLNLWLSLHQKSGFDEFWAAHYAYIISEISSDTLNILIVSEKNVQLVLSPFRHHLNQYSLRHISTGHECKINVLQCVTWQL